MSKDRADRLAITALGLSGLLTGALLTLIVGHVLARGLPVIDAAFLLTAPERMGRAGGIFPSVVGTLAVTALAVAIATPLGVMTAVYLAEYTREGFFVRLCRFATAALAGIPSIIFGLFGFVLFVIRLGLGWSVLSGGLTLAIMILPIIIRTAEEAIRAVPRSWREISYALGGTRWQTVTRVVLPGALPGVLTGVMLGVARSVGETAAVILTAGTTLRLPRSPLDPVRTMAVHFFILAREGISMDQAYGTAAVLILLILGVNFVAYWLLGRITARRG